MPRPGEEERGAVTAELAMALPLLVAVTVALVWLLSVGAAQVRMVDAAREGARALARGDDETTALEVARQVAPNGARFAVSREGDLVRVTATGPAGAMGVRLLAVPKVRLSAAAVALVERASTP
jgi:hypothetical protein